MCHIQISLRHNTQSTRQRCGTLVAFKNDVNLNINYSLLTTMYRRDIRILTVVASHGASKVTHHNFSKHCLNIWAIILSYIVVG